MDHLQRVQREFVIFRKGSATELPCSCAQCRPGRGL